MLTATRSSPGTSRPNLPLKAYDELSIAIGRAKAIDSEVADRVTLAVIDLGDDAAAWSPRYDVITFVECVHDVPRPVEVLRHARASLRPRGTVLVVDERAAKTFTAPGDEVERFFANTSAIWCLPQGRVRPDPEPVGTLILPADMRDLVARAATPTCRSSRSSTRSGASTG